MPEVVLANAKDFAGSIIENKKGRQETRAIGFKCIFEIVTLKFYEILRVKFTTKIAS